MNIPQPDAAALQRLPARKAVISRRNETLERILKNPPPRGAVIRFTDGKLRPRPPAERGMPAWLASNNTGVLVSVRKSSGSIRLPDSLALRRFSSGQSARSALMTGPGETWPTRMPFLFNCRRMVWTKQVIAHFEAE